MKKIVLTALFLGSTLLAGCTKKLTCEEKIESDNLKYISKYVAKYDKDIINNIKWEMEFSDKEDITYMCSLSKVLEESGASVECKGNKVTVSNYQKVLNDDELKIENFKESMKEKNHTCK